MVTSICVSWAISFCVHYASTFVCFRLALFYFFGWFNMLDTSRVDAPLCFGSAGDAWHIFHQAKELLLISRDFNQRFRSKLEQQTSIHGFWGCWINFLIGYSIDQPALIKALQKLIVSPLVASKRFGIFRRFSTFRPKYAEEMCKHRRTGKRKEKKAKRLEKSGRTTSLLCGWELNKMPITIGTSMKRQSKYHENDIRHTSMIQHRKKVG